jgi:hypothetical protein
VTPPLAAVPIAHRKRLAGTLATFAVLLAGMAGVAATDLGSVGRVALFVVAAAAALLLVLMTWGVAHSITVSRRGAGLPRHTACSCGHQHDMAAMVVTDPAPSCPQDGTGVACGHDCGSCVLRAQVAPTEVPSNP